MCKCVHLHHADIWLFKLRAAVMEDVVKYSEWDCVAPQLELCLLY